MSRDNDPTNSRYRHLILKGNSTYRRFISAEDKNAIEQSVLEPQEGNTPAHGTYGALLFHPLWRAKRQEILRRDYFKCVICQDENVLQVHHRQYLFIVKQNQFKLPWDYPDHLLISLCESCHKRGHSKFKVPIINI
jgi:hypothetical protein